MKMRHRARNIWLVCLVIILASCSKPWQETIRYGDLSNSSFSETIPFENKLGLAIVKVKIGQESYDFLFDTGAPLTVSNKLHERFKYKVLSSGGFRDSENQRTTVEYVEVPSLFIGNQEFINQTAVVTNFENNPLIKCLEIDGIIGSNLMRYCNWTIDFSEQSMTLFTQPPVFDSSRQFELPFKASNQYDAKIDFNIGKAKLSNIKLDYGSNGAISVPNKIYNTLVERGIVETIAIRRGFSQSGLFGDAVVKDKAYAISDSVLLGDLHQSDVVIRSGGSGLLGTKILSKHQVTIDWDQRRLIFEPHPIENDDVKTFGVPLSINSKDEVYVLSVIENSEAWKKGIRGGQLVKWLGSIEFNTNEDYCEYAFTQPGEKSSLSIGVVDSTGIVQDITLTPFNIKSFK